MSSGRSSAVMKAAGSPLRALRLRFSWASWGRARAVAALSEPERPRPCRLMAVTRPSVLKVTPLQLPLLMRADAVFQASPLQASPPKSAYSWRRALRSSAFI